MSTRRITPSATPQRGFSLVELMVAVALGLALSASIVYVLFSNKIAYLQAENTARLQENGRFALDYLAHDLRQVNFWGESRFFDVGLDSALPAATGDCAGAAAAYALDSPLWAATSSAGLSCRPDAISLPGAPADVLAVKYAAPTPVQDSDGDGDLDAADGLHIQRPYLLANQQLGTVFLVPSANAYTEAPTIVNGGDVPNGRAWEYRSYVYYVRDRGAQSAPTLARKRLQWDAGTGALAWVTEDLAEGVEAMRLLFGLDTNNDGSVDLFSPAADVSAWDRVVAARVYLLVRSPTPDRQFADDKTYRLGDTEVSSTAADTASQGATLKNFHRMVLTTSVNLRNPQLIAAAKL